jgi:ABC-2 type transport system permease protein
MKKTFTILKNEIYFYFISPSAYLLMVIFLVLSGFFFFSNLSTFYLAKLQPLPWAELEETQDLNKMVIQPFFHSVSIIYLLIPILTMRLIAEEKKSGTIELLFTSPIQLSQILIGKFGASIFMLLIMLIFTLPFPLFLYVYGNPDPGLIISGYVGLFLVGISFLSLGIFASSLTENQIIAAVLGFGLIFIFWIIGAASYLVGYRLGKFFIYLSLLEHFHIFTKGLIELKGVIFFLSFSFFSLFLTHQTLNNHQRR